MSYVRTLKISNFRSYYSAQVDIAENGLVVLHGPNGAGKTNILEAISLLVPGRGLRSVKPTDVQNHNAPEAWAVSAELAGDIVETRIGVGLDPQTEKRTVRINGAPVRNQSMLGEYLSCVWLTPQMDRLFLDAAGQRRRFLDRLIFAFDPSHSGRTSRYDNALAQRSKLLKEGRAEPVWLDGLEAQIAETGIAIAAARLDFIEKLQQACDQGGYKHFPRAVVNVDGHIEDLLSKAPALEVEDIFKFQLKETRAKDAQTGGAASGPHKSDFLVTYAAKNMPAAQCSTGEQKGLLIAIILAHARLISAERGAPPILLLDEVSAHLDENRRTALYEILNDTGAQVWLTGTDRALFAQADAAHVLCVPGDVTP